ncbi:MAG: S8 family serine peptidase [Deltaproteobacteria bacterium]|nr:S8 family serine peptidase [Deltaproteobacteria bacterium]
MNATSAATASASRLGAMLLARYPDYWPKTHRGLIVHSARWLPNMVGNINLHNFGSSQEVESLLRIYGFGEPHQPRLFGSGESGVTMIIQDMLNPYDINSKPGDAKLGHFNLHKLPWPNKVFDNHPDIECKLKVTLSYFINPNPGTRCWDRSEKYRYASHLLRFNFKRATESDDVFRNALEKRITDEENDTFETRPPSDQKWALDPKLRGKAGSLVQDIWKGSPADLREMTQVAVYPAKGWFATRSFPSDHEFHNCHQRLVRYSLIISIDTAQDIGLYTSISNLISVSV